jgi:hypothetical protein
MINKIVLNLGYVESASLGYMVHQTHLSFETKEAMFASFAEYIWKLYCNYNDIYDVNECCAATLQLVADAKFCVKCGSHTSQRNHLNQFMEFINNYFHSSADNSTIDRDYEWTPWNIDWKDMDNQLHIVEFGAEMIIISLVKHNEEAASLLGDSFKINEKVKNRFEVFRYQELFDNK